MKTYLEVSCWDKDRRTGGGHFVLPSPNVDFVAGVRTAEHHIFCLYLAEQGFIEKRRPILSDFTKIIFEIKNGEPVGD